MENSSNDLNNSIYKISLKEVESIINELHEHKFLGILVNKTMNISSEKIKMRVFEIIKMLNSTQIDIEKLKEIIFEGLPDDISSLRSLAWKLLLKYLPLNLDDWENHIDAKRSEYISAKEKIITKLELDKLNYQKNKSTERSASFNVNKFENKINNQKDVEVLDNGKINKNIIIFTFIYINILK